MVWTFSFSLVAAGSAIGLVVAAVICGFVSEFFEQATGIALDASIGQTEFALAASIAGLGALAALAPAAFLYRRPVVDALRGG